MIALRLTSVLGSVSGVETETQSHRFTPLASLKERALVRRPWRIPSPGRSYLALLSIGESWCHFNPHQHFSATASDRQDTRRRRCTRARFNIGQATHLGYRCNISDRCPITSSRSWTCFSQNLLASLRKFRTLLLSAVKWAQSFQLCYCPERMEHAPRCASEQSMRAGGLELERSAHGRECGESLGRSAFSSLLARQAQDRLQRVRCQRRALEQGWRQELRNLHQTTAATCNQGLTSALGLAPYRLSREVP